MSPQDLLLTCRQAGILLAADGDALSVNAPKGMLTPELRDQLAHQKPAILALIEPCIQFVELKGGIAMPAPALRLAWSLEERGIPLQVNADHQFVVPNDPRLTPADRAGLSRWHQHVAALIEYANALPRVVM